MKKFPFFANVLRLNPHSLLPWPCQIMPAKLTKFWQEEIIFTSQYMLFCCPNLHSLYKESIYCFIYLKTLYIFFQSTEYNKFSRNGMKMASTNILRLRGGERTYVVISDWVEVEIIQYIWYPIFKSEKLSISRAVWIYMGRRAGEPHAHSAHLK